jgi:hypothetical protein
VPPDEIPIVHVSKEQEELIDYAKDREFYMMAKWMGFKPEDILDLG